MPAVFSSEPPVKPEPPTCAEDEAIPTGARMNCEWGYGSATFVTGAFGFAAAGWGVREIAKENV